jgi:hypothetical protein
VLVLLKINISFRVSVFLIVFSLYVHVFDCGRDFVRECTVRGGDRKVFK